MRLPSDLTGAELIKRLDKFGYRKTNYDQYGFHLTNTMPVTITIKNIPDAIYLALKNAAEASQQSLNGEVIARLAPSLQTQTDLPHTHIDRAHALRQSLGKVRLAKLTAVDAVNTIRADRKRR